MTFDKIIENFIRYADKTDNIRAAMIIGSRAREEKPADDYSDLDIIVFANDTKRQISETDWLSEIGDYHITFVETLPIGAGQERRVMFSDACDVDFAILPAEYATEIAESKEIQNIFRNGMKIIVDKDKILSNIGSSVAQEIIPPMVMPTEIDFDNMVNDFWYHCVWIIKKLNRGENWTAIMCLDGYMKHLLLKMIEIYASNQKKRIWHNGRFLEEWAKGEIVKLLENCFARYDKKDIVHALKGTMNLFSVIARKNAENLEYRYAQMAEDFVWQWMKDSSLKF